MSIFSRLFESPVERKVKRLFTESQTEVERMTKPLANVGLAVVKASQACSEAFKPMINVSDAKEKQQAEIYVFYEFIYFFMHLTMRSAFSQLKEQQIERLQGFLGPLISSTAVDSFFAHWPQDLKEKMGYSRILMGLRGRLLLKG